MAYTANIPLASEGISSTQARILANFLNIGTIAAVDHGGFGTATEGKHSAIHLTTQSSPATGATEWGMFVKNDSLGQPQIYLTPPGSTPAGTLADLPVTGGATIIRLGDVVVDLPSPIAVGDPRIGNGETQVFGGILVKWGRCYSSVGGGILNTYAGSPHLPPAHLGYGLGLTSFPNETIALVISGGATPINVTRLGFGASAIAAGTPYFIAIGY